MKKSCHTSSPAHADVAHIGADRPEAAFFVGQAAEGLDEQRAVDGQRFRDLAAHVGVVVERLAADLAQRQPNPPRRQQEERQNRHRQHRQPPLDGEHDDQRRNQRENVGDDVGDGAGDGALRADDVVVEARDDFAGLGVGEKTHGHAAQMVEHLVAQVVDDAFAGTRAIAALHNAQQPAEQRHGKEADGQQIKPRQVAVGQHIVDERAVDERRDQPKQRRERNGDKQDENGRQIGTRILEDAYQQLPVQYRALLVAIVE